MAVTRLLDVNVLIALTWSHRVHHDAARSWFARVRGNGPATCPMTEAGFVRVVACNPSAVRQSVTVLDATSLLDRLRRLESRLALLRDATAASGCRACRN